MKKYWKGILCLALTASCFLPLAGCGGRYSGNSGGKEGADAAMEQVNTVIDQLAADAGLAKLSMDVNLKPIGALSEVETSASWSGGKAVFAYTDGENKVEYIVDTGRDAVKAGLIEILTSRNGSSEILSVTEAGTGYTTTGGKQVAPSRYADAAAVRMKTKFKNGHLYLDYEETYNNITNTKRYDFFMLGKSLAIHITSPDVNGKNGYAYFSTGKAKGLKNPRIDNSIYCEEVSITMLENKYFLSAYVDKAKSFATRITNMPGTGKTSTVHGMNAYYEINSAGQTNPMNELFYVTVSDNFLDCAYLTNGEKSEYRDMLNDLVIYDSWNFTTSYSARKRNLLNWAEKYGLDDVLLVEHRWQRDTLDISNPAHFPASTYWGTAEEFESYIHTVKEKMGWKLALHEDYWFIQPSKTNQYWNIDNVEKNVAQLADGTLRFGWQETSYANLSNLMAEYAKVESPQIKNAYDPDASFLDVNGGVDPSFLNQVTLNAESKTSRTLAQVVADNALLFKTAREIYGGPVISEGAQGPRSFGSAYAGFLESGSREITNCSECRIMPDYELKYIREKMANQGMGPPARFQVGGNLGTYNFDKLNATCLAYGHAGFIGDTHYSTPLLRDEIVNVYYTFRGIQPQYLDSNVTVEEISYFDASGGKLDLNAAILAGYDFRQARLYTRYSNGLEIYLNFAPENWKVTLNGNTYLLDQNGYAAENPGQNFVLFSSLLDGKRVDYVSCELYTYANPRGKLVDFGNGLTTAQTVIETTDGSVKIKPTSTVQREPIQLSKLFVDGQNGANGLTFYYTNGKTLTPFTQVSSGAEKGFVHTNGVLVYPSVVPTDNYGCAGSSATEYVAIGYKLEETGIIDLYNWVALQGPSGEHGYNVKVALDTLDNIVAQYTVEGDTQTAEATNIALDVKAGQQLLIIYEPIVRKNNEWFGYITAITYTAVDSESGDSRPEQPEQSDTSATEPPSAVGKVYKFADLYTGENGAGGLTFYYTADGKDLKPFTEASTGAEKGWIHENGVLVYPAVVPANNYGCAGSSSSEYVVMGYEIPDTGTINLFVWTALQGDSGKHGYHVKVALGSPDNIVYQYDNIGDTQNVVHNTYTMQVTKGDILYLIYEPVVWKDNEWFGYNTSLTYIG